ncbi:ACYL-[ACYL-CARRIER-PROTEIN] HYDROLASE [Salix koriyanagi]|uniref:Acyl-[acyl-carrier-protein] hydrolase n=1 Tax=Salix koriyanagi TaxID=2511006 RepID=A0A9Q1AAD7_9ROSI|nr:ACYL-[ACYL-CARRIER-PROTEIN] HYDROLASE [Salix koriyanagi]
MASMATNGAAGLYFPGNLHEVEKKNNVTILAMAKAGSPCSWNMIAPKKRSSLRHSKCRFVEDRLVYRQTFSIRSYEIGPDKTATMETLMNLLQETALNHVTSSGLAGKWLRCYPRDEPQETYLGSHSYSRSSTAIQLLG